MISGRFYNSKNINLKFYIQTRRVWFLVYTITLYTFGHLKISWEVFTKKSVDILSFRCSFTLSNFSAIKKQSKIPILVHSVMNIIPFNWYQISCTECIKLLWNARNLFNIIQFRSDVSNIWNWLKLMTFNWWFRYLELVEYHTIQ